MAKSGFFNPDTTPQDPSTKSSFYPGGDQDVEQVDGSFYETDDAYVEVVIAEAVGDLVGDAQAAATAAAASEAAAAGSASNAATSATNALTSETNAAASAAAAAASETAAETSETNAANSASSSASSAANALTSETNAAASAAAALASETNAAASAAAALASETNAAASEAGVAANAAAAATSEANAAQSAADADADRIAAQAAAAAAATSETNAANSASAASTSASGASTSATNAANSASAAAGSASSASTSATNAANSAADAAQSAADAEVAAESIPSFPQETSIIYAAKAGGNDANSGRFPYLPKLTIAAALTAASALIGGGVTRAEVLVLDAGVYTENLTVPANVSLHAPNATLVGTLSLAANANATLLDHYAASSSTTMLTTADASGSSSHYEARIVDGRGIGGALTGVTCMENASSGRVLMLRIKLQVFVTAGGFGIRDNSGAGFGHVHFLIPDLYLAGNNATGIRSNNANTNLIGYIDHILEIAGNPTGTTGVEIGASGGTVKLTASEIVADTVYSIHANGTCYLQCPKQTGAFSGSLTNAGGWAPSAADKLLYGTGANTTAETTLTSYGRTLIDDADAATARGTLGLVIGTNVQAYNANLTTLASLGNWKVAYTNGSGNPVALSVGALGTILAGQGASAAPAFTSAPQITTIELGHASDTTLARASAGNVSIEGNIIYRAGGTDVPVADGGTGASDAATARSNLGAAPTNDPTFTGTIVLPTAAGTNYIAAGTGDGASFTTYNVKFQSWWGIGFSGGDGTVRCVLDARSGTWNVLGGYQVNGASVYYSGGTDVPVSDGGTGASSAYDARWNLGVALSAVMFVFDGGGAVIAAGTKVEFIIPVDCTLYDWYAISDVTSQTWVTLYRSTYANYDTMTDIASGSAPYVWDTKKATGGVGSWSVTSLTAGDVLRMEIGGNSAAKRFVVCLRVRK